MRWEHLELAEGVFTVPEKPIGGDIEGYMKSGEEFSIMLPQALVDELKKHQNGQTEGYVFKGRIEIHIWLLVVCWCHSKNMIAT